MCHMVTIEILQQSQRTRPRKWIPVFSAIAFFLSAILGVAMMSFLFPDIAFFASIHKQIPDLVIKMGEVSYTLLQMLGLVFVPGAVLGFCLIFLVPALRICGFRHGYWFLGAFLLLGWIALLLLYIFYTLYYLVPAIANVMANIPKEPFKIGETVYRYTAMVLPFVFTLYWLICMFYNVNYPGEYEEIYELRKKRLRSYRTTDERIQYNKRFYNDYKKGNWISMMLDLHFESLALGSSEPMREDAYDFLVYYANLCDNTVNKAVFDAYASEGRYYECRTIFHDLKAKADTIDRGANIVLPHYVPAKPKKKPAAPLKAETPKRVEPPLRPVDYKTPSNDRVKTWRPDDI